MITYYKNSFLSFSFVAGLHSEDYTMSSSESGTEDDSDNADDFFDDIFTQSGDNAFAFEPEYTESEVDERLRAYPEFDDIDDENNSSVELEDGWCTCGKCVHMDNPDERVCCRSFNEIIGDKFGTEKCIAMTTAFRDVCLNKNVLQAALGTWRQLTEQDMQISNKSYRFIGYRQYISWVYGWLGKDVRKVIPSCAVNTIRQTFPAADNIYVPYKDSS